MDEAIVVVPHDALIALAGVPINPILTIVASNEPRDEECRYFVSCWQDTPHDRVMTVVRHMKRMRAIARGLEIELRRDERIVFQAEDVPLDVPSISWESRVDWTSVGLIPDLYYLLNGGYEDFRPAVPAWEARLPSMIWRGSSTGSFAQFVGDLDGLSRYRLCKLAQTLGEQADVGITDVVQAASPNEAQLIRERLIRESLVRAFVPMTDMAAHRFILDIDGNSNSWNFMMKLRLGCCVLRVDSPWKQWFSDRLIPWRHYVPVAADLSNFLDRAQWCFENQAECAVIAQQGRQFALDMTFADEMTRAARVTFGANQTSPAA